MFRSAFIGAFLGLSALSNANIYCENGKIRVSEAAFGVSKIDRLIGSRGYDRALGRLTKDHRDLIILIQNIEVGQAANIEFIGSSFRFSGRIEKSEGILRVIVGEFGVKQSKSDQFAKNGTSQGGLSSSFTQFVVSILEGVTGHSMKDQSLRRVEIFGREVVNANLEKLLSSFGFIRSDLPTQRPRKGLRVVLPTVGGKGAKVVGSSLLLSGKVSPAMELWLMYGSSASNMAGFSTKLMMKDSRTDAYDWILSLDVKHEAESGSGIAD